MSCNNKKKQLILNTVSIDLGCGSSCKRPKLSSIFHPKPRPKIPSSSYRKQQNRDFYFSYSNSCSTSSTTTSGTTLTNASPTTFSPYMDGSTLPPPPPQQQQHQQQQHYSCFDSDYNCQRPVRGFGRVGGESMAVEKDSDDPYLDFRHSMLQMILEKEIYSKDDLRELLNCFLQLNSPYHHGIIVKAFTEIWNGVFSVKTSSSSHSYSSSSSPSPGMHYYYHGCRSRDY